MNKIQPQNIIEMKDLYKSYFLENSTEIPVLKWINLEIKRKKEEVISKLWDQTNNIIWINFIWISWYQYTKYIDFEWNINISFPIYRFWIDDWINNYESRRKQSNKLKSFIHWLFWRIFEEEFWTIIDVWYLNSLIVLFAELMKNSMDHTNKEAYFWLHLKKLGDKIILYFLLADEWKWLKNLVSKLDQNYKTLTDTNFSTIKNNWINMWIWMTLLSEECLKWLNTSISSFEDWEEYNFYKIEDIDWKIDKNIFIIDINSIFYYLWTTVINKEKYIKK